MIAVIFTIISLVVAAYLILVMADILASWLPALAQSPLLMRIRPFTAPFLRLFRGLPLLSTGGMDFSPLLGLVLLQAILQICLELARSGSITLGLVLGLLLGMTISSLAWILGFLGILALIRLGAMVMGASSVHPLIMALDTLLGGFIRPLAALASHLGQLPWGSLLGIFAAICIGLWFLLGQLANFLTSILASLPF